MCGRPSLPVSLVMYVSEKTAEKSEALAAGGRAQETLLYAGCAVRARACRYSICSRSHVSACLRYSFAWLDLAEIRIRLTGPGLEGRRATSEGIRRACVELLDGSERDFEAKE